MRRVIIAALAIMVSAVFANVSAKKKTETKMDKCCAAVQLKDGSDSLSYAAGYMNTEGLIPFLQQQFKVDTAYMADVIQGIKEAYTKSEDPRFRAYQAGGQIANMIQERMIPGLSNEIEHSNDSVKQDLYYAGFLASLSKDTTLFSQNGARSYADQRIEKDKAMKREALTATGKAWLAENAKKEGVKTTASGLQYKVITMGNGEKPKATDEVTVKYEGHLIDGTEFDSSYKRKDQTTKFQCNRVIKGWTEGLQLMPVGSKFEFYVPEYLGYGEHAMGNIPPYSTLIFTVELVDTQAAPAKKK